MAPLDLPYKVEKQVQLNGVNIFITLDANSDRLSLFVQEQKKLMWAWKAEFNSQYLEEITRKTGKPMTYEQFISMLNHSLNAQEPSAFVDLLNFHDLQLLKGQKTGNRA